MLRTSFVGVVVAGLLLAVMPAQATLIWGEAVQVVKITASNGQASSSEVFILPAGGDGEMDLAAGSSQLRGLDGDMVGEINGLELSGGSDSSVLLAFQVSAGPTPTDFTIETALLSFPAIVNPIAFATAGVTVTDNDGDGASLTGLYAGNKAYQARYNNPGVEFTRLLDPVIAAPDSTSVLADRDPGAGTSVIPATVSSIQATFKFKLSANDQAAGTSRFSVDIPEPAALILMGLGCLPLMRRRR